MRNHGGSTIERVSHQLMAKSQDKIVRVIANQSLFHFFSRTVKGGQNVGTCSGLELNELRQDDGKYKIKSTSHQLAEFRDKFLRVITEQPSFKIFPEFRGLVKYWHFFRTKIERAQAETLVESS